MGKPEIAPVIARDCAVDAMAAIAEGLSGADSEAALGFQPLDVNPALAADIAGEFGDPSVGVGNGYGLAYMATHQFANGRCLGMDLSAAMVERARSRTNRLENVTVETGDFLTKDFDGMSFDAIFSMEVFYYFNEINTGLDRAWSILAPGGTLWVAVNFYEENEQSADWPVQLGVPMQRWSMHDYVTGFERTGFAAIEQRMIAATVPEGSKHGDAPTLLTFGTKPGRQTDRTG